MSPETMTALSLDLASALSPTVLAIRAGLTPDPWQREVLECQDRNIVICASRQSGKSTVTAALAVHRLSYYPRSLVLLISPSLRQSQELFRKVREHFAALGNDAIPANEESALRLEFENGSRVVCLPGSEKTVRGFSGVDLIIEDEAARTEDALFQSLRPMLATSNGQHILLSSPYGQRGHFYDVFVNGGPSWRRFRIPADQCPRISPEWLAAERERTPAFWFRQEFECEFLQTEDALFDLADITAAVRSDIAPLFPQEAHHVLG